jgi:hypothetical protein
MWGPNKTIETAIEHTGEEPQSRHYLHTTVQSYPYYYFNAWSSYEYVKFAIDLKSTVAAVTFRLVE